MQIKENRGWTELKGRVVGLLSDLDHMDRLRSPVLKPQYGLDFCSNDYLGLRTDQGLHDEVRERVSAIPFSSGGSRLLGADHRDYQNLELQFAVWKKAPASLFFSSGYMANLAVGTVLRELGATIFSDELNHASMIDSQRLSKKGACHVFRHNDLEHLEELLCHEKPELGMIWTESLFGMNGDRASLKQLYELAQRHQCVLIVDEAHTLGCEGLHGSGSLDEAGLLHERVITVNPCGKALGIQGAFVAGPRWFLDCLVNRGRSFIYSTASSPWIVEALSVVLERMPQWDSKRRSLQSNVDFVRRGLAKQGYDGAVQSWIVPILLGEDALTVKVSQSLRDQGVHLAAIRPPTVPQGSARLRLSIRSDLAEEEILCGLRALEESLL